MDNLNIRQFKLLNGDDIIAVLSTKNDDNYIIERPVIITPNLLGNLSFTHWFPLSGQKVFKLYKNRCVQHVPVKDYVEDAYIKYVLNEKSGQVKIQSIQETLEEILSSRDPGYIEEEYFPEEVTPPKKVIH